MTRTQTDTYKLDRNTGAVLWVLVGDDPHADRYSPYNLSWVTSAGDVDGDENDDILLGYTNSAIATDPPTEAGEAFLFYGPPEAGATNLADADAVFLGENVGDYAGAYVATAGDVNSDGFDDILIGAPLNSEAVNMAGAVYLFYGSGPRP